jgi:hypothetical protein
VLRVGSRDLWISYMICDSGFDSAYLFVRCLTRHEKLSSSNIWTALGESRAML